MFAKKIDEQQLQIRKAHPVLVYPLVHWISLTHDWRGFFFVFIAYHSKSTTIVTEHCSPWIFISCNVW